VCATNLARISNVWLLRLCLLALPRLELAQVRTPCNHQHLSSHNELVVSGGVTCYPHTLQKPLSFAATFIDGAIFRINLVPHLKIAVPTGRVDTHPNTHFQIPSHGTVRRTTWSSDARISSEMPGGALQKKERLLERRYIHDAGTMLFTCLATRKDWRSLPVHWNLPTC